ncbi:helix-turn-helix domain-containing protein [Marinicella rhabdoformis]|uniref:helix-turn-helix domain-containing protein n=1 Tax=Marinicella rhabdoformis TaxID=2580566 RepID=UPI0012AECA35|nr:helix-turn-helix domain-containing protein [Marinicella rhabdoformis]
MAFSPLSVIYFMAFSHAALMAVILFKSAWEQQGLSKPPGIILAVLLSVMAYKLLEAGLIQSGLFRYVPHLIDWLSGVALLIGPLFLAYVRRMAGLAVWSKGKWVLQLLPFLVLFAFQLPDLILPAAQKVTRIASYKGANSSAPLPLQWVFLLLSIKLHLATYLGVAWRQLNTAAVEVMDTRADDAIYCLRWQKKLCLMLMVLEVFWLVLFLSQQFFGLGTLAVVSDYWLLLMSAIVLMMGYWGLQKPHLVLEGIASAEVTSASLQKPLVETGSSDKYNHSILDEDTAYVMAEEIKRVLNSQQLYLDSNLNLTTFSEQLGIRKHLVSQVINQTMDSTFFQLINQHRVNHARMLIEDAKSQFTLERIASESGFNNRVTFNKAFKEVEGCSPSVYRKTLKMAS